MFVASPLRFFLFLPLSFLDESKDGDLDGEDAHVRIKPEKIETLCKITKFTRRELQLMYRGFKQVINSNRN